MMKVAVAGSVGQRNSLLLGQRLSLVVWVGDDEYDGDRQCDHQNSGRVYHHALTHKLRILVFPTSHTYMTR